MILILRWVLFALCVMLTAWIIPGIFVENFQSALLIAFIIGLINASIKPFLMIITLPVNILTLGILGLVINALLFMLAGYFAPGVQIEGFWSALWGSLMLTFLGGIIFKIPERT